MYKIVAFVIFILLVVFIVLISVSSINKDTEPSYHPTSEDGLNYLTPDPDTVTTEPYLNGEASGNQDTAAPVTAPAVTDAPVTEPPVTDAPPAVTGPVTPPKTDEPAVEAPTVNVSDDLAAFLAGYPDTVLPVSEDAGSDYIDKIIFLGDSTTYGLRAYKMLDGGRDTTQVWTPASGTLTLSNASFATIVYPETDEELTIKQAVDKKKPEYLVITLGVNGVSFMDEDYFKSEYKKMLETVKETSPNTKIICQSMFPVARSYKSLGSINNDKIRAANRWIVEVAAEVGVKFVDTYSALADSEGWLPEAYHNGDGMHLNTESFTIELNNLRTHAYQ